MKSTNDLLGDIAQRAAAAKEAERIRVMEAQAEANRRKDAEDRAEGYWKLSRDEIAKEVNQVNDQLASSGASIIWLRKRVGAPIKLETWHLSFSVDGPMEHKDIRADVTPTKGGTIEVTFTEGKRSTVLDNIGFSKLPLSEHDAYNIVNALLNRALAA